MSLTTGDPPASDSGVTSDLTGSMVMVVCTLTLFLDKNVTHFILNIITPLLVITALSRLSGV